MDPLRIRHFFSASGRKVSEAHLETLGVLVLQAGRLIPSHGGLILFGRDAARQRIFPDATVSCARFRGANKVHFLDSLSIEGTILEALEEAPKFIRRNTRLAAKIETMRRQDVPEYPEIALREVLVNAVAHTDYSLTGMRIRGNRGTAPLFLDPEKLLPVGNPDWSAPIRLLLRLLDHGNLYRHPR